MHSHTGTGLDPEADFVNPRTFELAACGAFQLVDHRSLLGELFTQEEMATFRTVEELPQRIRSALHEADSRREMARAASDRVVREHTYHHRIKELLTQVGMAQPDRVGTILKGGREAARLSGRCVDRPELVPLLKNFPVTQRVELEQVAQRIRQRGPTATLSREELLILMLDEYRAQTRDLI